MKALIDGDILVYRVGYTTMEEPLGIALARMDTAVENILDETGCQEFEVFITSTDKSNYRFNLYPEYKANRKQPKPTWYEELRLHLKDVYKAAEVFGMEADDAMGIAQSGETVLCTIDKDLDQIPGQHYDFVKEVHYEVCKEDAERFFYFQLLTGDRTDNVPGCKGIGPVKAHAALQGAETTAEYERACLEAYQKAYGPKTGLVNMILFGRLLKIKQSKEEQLWVPATLGVLKQEENEAA